MTELYLDDRKVVMAPKVAPIQTGQALAWCHLGSNPSFVSVLDFHCFLGRASKEGDRVSISPLLEDYPGCGGSNRLDFVATPGGRVLTAATCEEEAGSRIIHAGIEREALHRLFSRREQMDHGPHLVPAATGGYWLVWGSGDMLATVSTEMLAARLDSTGRLVAGPFEVAARDEAWVGWSQGLLDVAPLAGGGFAVAWHGIPRSGGRAVRLRILDAEGESLAGPIDLPAPERMASIRLAADGSDRITVVWDGLEDGWRRVFAASFSAAGEPRVPPREVAVEVYDRDFGLPRLAASGDGAVVVWVERATSGEAWIAARKWSAVRGPVGLVARVPASVARKWPFLEVAPAEPPAGSFRVYWNPDGPDGLTEPARIRWREVHVALGPGRN